MSLFAWHLLATRRRPATRSPVTPPANAPTTRPAPSRCDRSRPPAKHGTRSGDQDRHPEEQFQIGRNLAPERGRHQCPSAGRSDRTVVRVRLDRRGLPTVGCITRVSLEGLRFRRPGSVSRCWPRLRSHSSQRGWPQRWHGCVRPRRAHRPAGWPGRCVAPSIRPCWRRWYPTTGARGWCSRRNRSGDKSRHPRAQTTPVEGSPHGPVGRRTGEPRRCRVVRGREDLPRETIRDLSTTPHQSMASTNQLPACSAWLQSAPPRLDRQARTASAALECGSAAAGRSKRVVPHCFPGGPLAP